MFFLLPSPIHSKVLPQYDASKVKVKGPGVEKGVLASLPVEFTVDTRDAGDADLEITITVRALSHFLVYKVSGYQTLPVF